MSTICCQSMQLLAFHQAEWAPMLTDRTAESIALSQVVQGRQKRSPPMTGQLERCPNDPTVILFRVRMCQLVAWHSGRTSVSDWRTFPVLCSTCS